MPENVKNIFISKVWLSIRNQLEIRFHSLLMDENDIKAF